MVSEFEEIGHSGGKITFKIEINDKGQRSYQPKYSTNRPVPCVLVGIQALYQGIPFGWLNLMNPMPMPGCFPVLIACDSQGMFGHNCPECNGYWRSGPWPNVCPYCATIAPSYQFLSEAQLRYVKHYCNVLSDALESVEGDEVVIDMDEVADAVGKVTEKPAFYVSEQSQQHKFNCGACGGFNDILGRFGYCSLCGTRNDLAEFEKNTVVNIRDRLNKSSAPEDCLRDSVASFDSFMSQVAKQLVALVPMTQNRKKRLLNHSFHDFEEICSTFKGWFDIDICRGIKDEERHFVKLMFLRRHVYEHNAGEVDKKYLDRSGDTSVCLKQRIRETQEDVHLLLGSLVKMVRNVHSTFHELFPPIPEPIKDFEKKKADET
ncbi:MAG: hypothetical protein KAV87_26860 [Desulfobacteraceae bacterium]|nr:hypothetical protein [Desulfobacteraceae bacterium]